MRCASESCNRKRVEMLSLYGMESEGLRWGPESRLALVQPAPKLVRRLGRNGRPEDQPLRQRHRRLHGYGGYRAPIV